MIIFSKKARLLVPVYIAYMILILCFITMMEVDILIRVFEDKVFVYFMIPPFVCGASLIEESLKKPSLVRMKNRKQAVTFLLFQQYLFALVYLLLWFSLIAIVAMWNGEMIVVADFVGKFVRYLLCLFLFVNVAGCFKRLNNKMLATIPFVAAYMVLALDVLAITSITGNIIGKTSGIIYLLFAWTFYQKSMLGIVMLAIFFVASYLLLGRFERKADFY